MLTERLERRFDVEAWRRVREENVVRERWVPRISARGTAGWDLGVKGESESGIVDGRFWRGAWRSDEAAMRGRKVAMRVVDLMVCSLR